ncbi:preprotein translocase subunit YajC [Georgenia sp. SYP-B2076]|uniref:preprotein translocase subunit YajC n=1 Tax=Georgenia sp. SYP-B2076 TaxID=2495881 RepID=UPI000F8D0553|nr:preprotein translocase subunit YajC [Georgenia sp. SYP-B2076]
MGYELFIFLALMIGVMWFTTTRGKKKVAEQRARMDEMMVPGTSVMTIGGFFGRIVEIDGDVVTLESPSGVETIWFKTAIKEIKEPPFAVVHDEEQADESLVVPDDASTLIAGPDDATRPDGHTPLDLDKRDGETGAGPRA